MYKDLYSRQLPDERKVYLDLSVEKFLVFVITVMLTFVFPAIYFEYYLTGNANESNSVEVSSSSNSTTNENVSTNSNNQLQDNLTNGNVNTNNQQNQSPQSPSGRVAGVQTSVNTSTTREFIGIDFQDRNNQIMLIGIGFLGLSVTTLTYLFKQGQTQVRPYAKSDIVW